MDIDSAQAPPGRLVSRHWKTGEPHVVKVDLLTWAWARTYVWRHTDTGHVFRKTSIRSRPVPHPLGRIVYLHREILGLDPSDRFVVDHLNGDPADNRLSNLERVSWSENIRRGIAMNLQRRENAP